MTLKLGHRQAAGPFLLAAIPRHDRHHHHHHDRRQSHTHADHPLQCGWDVLCNRHAGRHPHRPRRFKTKLKRGDTLSTSIWNAARSNRAVRSINRSDCGMIASDDLFQMKVSDRIPLRPAFSVAFTTCVSMMAALGLLRGPPPRAPSQATRGGCGRARRSASTPKNNCRRWSAVGNLSARARSIGSQIFRLASAFGTCCDKILELLSFFNESNIPEGE